jgi:uncharacterized protein YbjT (DUF2867 family)
MKHEGLILLTGGTGYIGGRLIRPLEATGRPLRLMVRLPERLRPASAPRSFVPRVAPGASNKKRESQVAPLIPSGL